MTDLNTQQQKAFDSCADATKQLVLLSTSIIAFMVTFAKDFVANVDLSAKNYAYIAWSFHFLSILSGIVVLLALTAQLEPKSTSTQTPSIRGAPATWSKIQIAAFLLGMIFTIVFGMHASQPTQTNAPTPTPHCAAIPKADKEAAKTNGP